MARGQVGADTHFRGKKQGRPRKSKKNKYGLRRRGRKS